ncbi:MAG TPA: DnaA/Hda family protein [Chlamydiales bacterium]|nr:DnaA/Hda family protein [Chlamydiales bacterium]
MHAWTTFVKQQEKEFGKETCDRWLLPLKIARFDACNLYLETENAFQELWFEEHIRPKLKSFVNNNNSPIRIHLHRKNGQVTVTESTKPKKKKTGKNSDKEKESKSSFSIAFEELDPSHSFREFIVTSENSIIGKLCDELFLESSNKATFNPLYIHGPKGSGKTHLLMSLAERFKKSGKSVLFARAELFTDHVVRAIRAAEMPKFREIYRKADVLIVDDVHEFSKKTATQEEFFHTFNTLHTASKQIILSSNITPQNLSAIEPRLVSRFEWGISLPLHPLDKKQVIEMIEKRALFFHFAIHPRTIEFIAETFASSPKAAVKALHALLLRTEEKGKTKGPLPVLECRTLIADLIDEENNVKLTPEKILQAVAEFYGIRKDDITGKSQSRDAVLPRQLTMHLCRDLLRLPYMKIGDLFSRDHSTVMSSIRQIEKLLQVSHENQELRGQLQTIMQALQTAK